MPPLATGRPVAKFMFASGKVIVLLAVNVVGVRVTLSDVVPPARPISSTPSCVAAARVKIPDALVDVIDVNAPVLAVVAPTVPLILIDAVPVKLVTVPEDGVPKAPPLTTNAPDEPVLTANAVATPVPKPDTPVEIGNPVALVKVPDEGVPSARRTRQPFLR